MENQRHICDVKGQTINSSFGAVNSPNYPDIYPTNEHCKLTVSAHDTSGFVISFKGFNVGTKSGGRCVDDYLQIQHDGTKIQLCGNDANRSEISTVASRFVISFHSADVRVAGIGFVLTYITKKFLREQFELINKRKQETLLGAGNAPYPPLVNDVPASRFRNAKDKPILRVTALTSLKKNVINQANTTSNNSKPATSSLSLEHVLQLLAGMLYDCVTDFSSLYQGSSKAKNVTKSKTAISKDATQYEDYTKAGIYKRVGIPSDIQSNNKQSNKSQTLFKQLPARQQSSNLLSKPVYPLRMGSRQWYDRSSIEHATPKTLSSAEEWKMYWNACKEINSRRSSIPVRLQKDQSTGRSITATTRLDLIRQEAMELLRSSMRSAERAQIQIRCCVQMLHYHTLQQHCKLWLSPKDELLWNTLSSQAISLHLDMNSANSWRRFNFQCLSTLLRNPSPQ
eukprot:gene15849-17447_t